MNNLFNPDNPVMDFLAKLLDCVVLNLLWLVCCIPVFTAGASTTALYTCTLKIAREEKISTVGTFFKAFKSNFKDATVVGLILTAAGAGLAFDGYIFSGMSQKNAIWAAGSALFVFMTVCYCIVLLYVFPLLSRFKNTWNNMIKNAFIIGVRFIICTIIIAAVHFGVFFVTIRLFNPMIFLGEGLAALISSYFLKNVLDLIEESQKKAVNKDDEC